MLVKCCALCTYGKYSTRKSKLVTCEILSTTKHQLERKCKYYVEDESRIARIVSYVEGLK